MNVEDLGRDVASFGINFPEILFGDVCGLVRMVFLESGWQETWLGSLLRCQENRSPNAGSIRDEVQEVNEYSIK